MTTVRFGHGIGNKPSVEGPLVADTRVNIAYEHGRMSRAKDVRLGVRFDNGAKDLSLRLEGDYDQPVGDLFTSFEIPDGTHHLELWATESGNEYFDTENSAPYDNFDLSVAPSGSLRDA